jgi:hypothetical protein
MTALAALTALTALTFAYPIARSFSYVEIDFNEGWNAYRAQTAAAGVPLYGAQPRFTVTNYPPLSFHIIGFLGRIAGDPNSAGRYVSLVCIGLNALLIFAIVRRFAATEAAAYGALTFLVWLPVFISNRIGVNDPQMLATVFGLAGLYAYVARPESGRWLALSALAFAVSVFTKHNLLAIPAAVGLHLLVRKSWKQFAIWVSAFAAATAVLIILTLKIDGPYFFAHLLAGRTYSLRVALWKSAEFATTFQLPAAAALVWIWRNARVPERQILVIAAVLSFGIAAPFSGGHGVGRNIFLDALILLAIVLAIALSDLGRVLQPQRIVAFGITLLLPLITPLAFAIQDGAAGTVSLTALAAAEQQFQETVQFVASRPGRAFCQDPLVCLSASKPDEVCMYFTPEQIKLGRLDESDLIALINTYRFQAIEIAVDHGQLIRPEGYSERLMTAISDRYRIALRNLRYTVLIPNLN